MNDDEDRLINEFLNTLIQSPTRPEEIQVCPICGGKLHVGFGAYKRFGEDLFGVSVDCKSCNLGMAIDYAGPLPIWLTSD
jgi:hypothetical protein